MTIAAAIKEKNDNIVDTSVDGAQNESCGGFDKNLAEPAHPGHPPSTHNTIDIRLFISEQIIALVLCKET